MIDKIGYTKPALRADAKRRISSTGSTQFSDLLDAMAPTDEAEHVATTAPVASTGLLIGLQEVSEDEIARKRALKKGKNTLEILEKLRDGLLMGTLSGATIHQLETLVRTERAVCIDPRLQEILDEIEVRAAVELAKLDRARGQ